MTLDKQDDRPADDDDDVKEPEITVDTPLPVPVLPPVETNSVATPVVSAAVDAPANNVKHTSCTVFAPATLEAGYTFTANVDGIDFTVTVPAGGVTEGQAFQVPYPTSHGNTSAPSTPVEHSTSPLFEPLEVDIPAARQIPTGRWRNDVCDCCEVAHTGIFWQGCCCNPLLLGQVMTRNKLNTFGVPSHSYQNTFYIVSAIWGCYLLVFWLVAEKYHAGALAIAWPIFMTILVSNTRFILRKRYNIPFTCCDGCDGRCDDICCGLWCSCCVTIQMARHTHAHQEYP